MQQDEFGLGGILTVAEAAEPVASVDVVAHNFRERFGARSVSILFVDLLGGQRLRNGAAHTGAAPGPGRGR